MNKILWTRPSYDWLKREVSGLETARTHGIRSGLDNTFSAGLSEGRAIDLCAVRTSEAVSKERHVRLKNLLDRVQPHKAAADLSVAGFGLYITVSIEDGETEREQSFVLGGIDESIAEVGYWIVSGLSPMGRAVMGKEVGYEGSYMVGRREVHFEIKTIEPAPSVESLAKVA